MTDHPPAIPAIQVKLMDRILACPDCVKHQTYIDLCEEHRFRRALGVALGIATSFTTPLGLSPEQPARIGGHDE